MKNEVSMDSYKTLKNLDLFKNLSEQAILELARNAKTKNVRDKRSNF